MEEALGVGALIAPVEVDEDTHGILPPPRGRGLDARDHELDLSVRQRAEWRSRV